MNKTLIILTCLLLQIQSKSQTPTIQDCLGAIPICNRIYSESFVKPGCGNICDEIDKDNTCGFPEEGSVWYTFTVNKSGDFGFIITPDQLTDDYDWALFNITNASCSDIKRRPSLLVSCNAAGDNDSAGIGNECSGRTGANGSSNFNEQVGGCNGPSPSGNPRGYTPFNDYISVIKGNTYVLMISNFTQSGRGYTIDFGLTDVGVIDQEAPIMSDINFPSKCQDRLIEIQFNEPIKPSSFDEDDFEVNAPNGASLSFTLASSSNTRTIQLKLNNGVTEPGMYSFNINSNGTNEFLDNCNNPFPRGVNSFDFEVISPGLPVVDLGNDTTICEPISLSAFYPQSNYSWSSGGNQEEITVSSTGNYSVTVANTCGTSSDVIKITAYQKPNIQLGKDTLLCPNDELNLDATSEVATYQWQDNSSENTFTVTREGMYTVLVTNICGMDRDTIQVNYRVPLSVDLGNDTLICDGIPLMLDAFNEGADQQWQDNSTNPELIVERTGNYTVTVSNICNSVSDTKHIILLEGPPSIELGEDLLLCPEEEKELDATNQEATYVWQNGSNDSIFNVTELGIYEVTVTSACGTTTDDIVIDYLLPLEVRLQEDFFLCQPSAILSTRGHPDATYRWQHGEEGRAIEVNNTGTYILTAETICETKQDTVQVKDCDICKVYMPNVFSPNGDGINDQFVPLTDPACELNNYLLRVYDRWGTLVFESYDPQVGWNGRFQSQSMPASSFVWQLSYQVIQNEEIFNNEKIGSVAVVGVE